MDHDHDEGLCTIDEIAAEAVSNAIKLGAEACVTVSTQSFVKETPIWPMRIYSTLLNDHSCLSTKISKFVGSHTLSWCRAL